MIAARDVHLALWTVAVASSVGGVSMLLYQIARLAVSSSLGLFSLTSASMGGVDGLFSAVIWGTWLSFLMIGGFYTLNKRALKAEANV